MVKKIKDLKSGDVIIVSGKEMQVAAVRLTHDKCTVIFAVDGFLPRQDPDKKVEVISSW